MLQEHWCTIVKVVQKCVRHLWRRVQRFEQSDVAVAGWCRRQVEGKLVGEGEGGRGKERQGVARALGVVTISLLKLCTEIQNAGVRCLEASSKLQN